MITDSHPDEWQWFEGVVAKIEQALAGSASVVTKQPKLPTTDGTPPIAVDAAIRTTVGSMTVLTIIECRYRSRPQGLDWLRELRGRMDSLSAHGSIAVSSLGFADTCHDYAERNRIALRVLDDLAGEDLTRVITDFVLKMAVDAYSTTFTAGEIELENGVEGKAPELDRRFREAMERVPRLCPIAFRLRDDRPVYEAEVHEALLKVYRKRSVPLLAEGNVALTFPEPHYTYTTVGTSLVVRIRYTFIVRRQSEDMPWTRAMSYHDKTQSYATVLQSKKFVGGHTIDIEAITKPLP